MANNNCQEHENRLVALEEQMRVIAETAKKSDAALYGNGRIGLITEIERMKLLLEGIPARLTGVERSILIATGAIIGIQFFLNLK